MSVCTCVCVRVRTRISLIPINTSILDLARRWILLVFILLLHLFAFCLYFHVAVLLPATTVSSLTQKLVPKTGMQSTHLQEGWHIIWLWFSG